MQNRTLPLEHVITIDNSQPIRVHGFFNRTHNNWRKATVGLTAVGGAILSLCLTPEPSDEKMKYFYLSFLLLGTAWIMYAMNKDSYNKETYEIDIKISR